MGAPKSGAIGITGRCQPVERVVGVGDRHRFQRVDAKVREVSAGIFQGHTLLEVDRRLPTAHILFYAAVPRTGPAVMLTGHPEAFGHLLKMEQRQIKIPEQAIALARLFFTCTRLMKKIFYFADRLEDLLVLPHMSSEEADRLQAVRQKYAETVAPFRAEDDLGGYWVTGYAVIDRDLCKIGVGVGAKGALEVHVDALEENLPLVFGM